MYNDNRKEKLDAMYKQFIIHQLEVGRWYAEEVKKLQSIKRKTVSEIMGAFND